jgi:hypothetical protein
MKAARFRLIVAATLFMGWMGYLGYLALGHSKPVIISRSQMLVATYLVKGDVAVDESGKPIDLVHVRDSFGKSSIKTETIKITNLENARLPGGKPITASGTYLLPLEMVGQGLLPDSVDARFRVVGAPSGQRNEYQSALLLVYPWNAEVERQVRELATKDE